MRRFLAIRFLQALIALWVITILVFLMSHLSGNPVDALLPDDAPAERIDMLIEHWGLDRPLHVQYFTFMGNVIQGDFGESLKWRGQSALGVVLERLPATIHLGLLAIFISLAVALPLGVLAAVHKGSKIDAMASGIALFGQSLPTFWLGIILIWIFAVWLKVLPSSGYGGLSYMILPAVAMAWFQVAAVMRLTRSSMIEVLHVDYIKLARLKGVPEWKIIWKHAFRNAAIVPLTYFSVLAGSILTGSVAIETVFSWPGIGWLAIEAIRGRDFPVVQTIVIFFAVMYLLLNFITDALYAYVDPRIRN